MSYLLERDTLNGAAGKAVLIRDGQVQELFGAKNVKTQAEITSSDMKVVGTKRTQQKPGAVKQTGTMTVYYGTPLFLEMMAEYVRNGSIPYFNLQTTNDDPTATVGAQVVAYYNCKLTGTVPLSILDAEADMLTMDLSFSYEDFEVLSSFRAPTETGT